MLSSRELHFSICACHAGDKNRHPTREAGTQTTNLDKKTGQGKQDKQKPAQTGKNTSLSFSSNVTYFVTLSPWQVFIVADCYSCSLCHFLLFFRRVQCGLLRGWCVVSGFSDRQWFSGQCARHRWWVSASPLRRNNFVILRFCFRHL